MKMPAARTHSGLLDEMAECHPARNFVTDQTRRLTFSEFRDETRQLAKGFHALGVRKGDKVAILMANQVEWLLADFAVTMLGAVLVALNTWWRRSELLHALSSTDASVLVMTDRYLRNDYAGAMREMGDLAQALPQLRRIVNLGDDLLPGAIPFAELYECGSAVPDQVLDEAARAVLPEDTAYLLFTSGSTARAKAVELVHRGNIENPHGIGERMHLTEQDRVLLPTSLFWSYSCINGLFAAMTHGSSIVLQFKFDAAELLQLVEAEGCTAVYTQPNMVLALHGHPDRHIRDLGTWRTGICRPNVIHLIEEMGAHEMITSYGLTECYGNSVNSDAFDPIGARMCNSGRPLPNTELDIVDPRTREAVARGEVGEIRLRGYVTPGYYRNPERTAEAIDAEGWFYTGDLGTIEQDGTVTFKGRIKEMIKTGGINVTPADVEELLQTYPGVQQAIVVGVPDPVRDEIVAALVVTKPGFTIEIDDLVHHCRNSAAAFKVPRLIDLITLAEVPLTDTGKVHRGRVQERLTEKRQRQLQRAASS